MVEGAMVEEIAVRLHLARHTVDLWGHRFDRRGLAGLEDAPRAGRPATYTREPVGEIVAAALTDPQPLDRPVPSCSILDPRPISRLLARAQGHRHEAQPAGRGVADRRVALAPAGDVVWRAGGPGVRAEKGARETRYVSPPADRVVVCRDQMGPEAATSWPGERRVAAAPQQDPAPRPAGRARQASEDGRREAGDVFGALRPATGDAFTAPSRGRTTAHGVDLREQVDGWLPSEVERVSAILDNLSTPRAPDVLLFARAHPRWEFVFQPKYAAYLNLIEPWWKGLRALALAGRRFESWADICQAVQRATASWNAHKHPFVWGRRRRHRPRRSPGIARFPAVA